MTNAEAREWYRSEIQRLRELISNWNDTGASVESQARRAHQLRRQARLEARLKMDDRETVDLIARRDKKKYGDSEGPTFAWLVRANLDAGRTEKQAYGQIIDSSTRLSDDGNDDRPGY